MDSFPKELGTLLTRASVFTAPWFIKPPLAWAPHIPFSFWLVDVLKPKMIVELGTHIGNSYFSFCQAVQATGISCKTYAVDTWQGDVHAGHYDDSVFSRVSSINEQYFAAFSRLVRTTFEEARGSFSDGSIDLLHIDGLHTYDAVKSDFESWLPKLSSRGVVLFHDTNVRENDFGVWRFWAEVKDKYPSIEFIHGHGLGVLVVGDPLCAELSQLIALGRNEDNLKNIRQFFGYLGGTLSRAHENIPHATPIVPAPVIVAPPVAVAPPPTTPPPVTPAPPKPVAHVDTDFRSLEVALQCTERLVDQLTRQIDNETAKTQAAQFFSSVLSARLEGAVKELSYASQDKLAFDAYRKSVEYWNTRWVAILGQARLSKTWRLMRAYNRFKALVIRREDEGIFGFIRWLLGSLSGKEFPLKRSYDHLESLEEMPLFSEPTRVTKSTYSAPGAVKRIVPAPFLPPTRIRTGLADSAGKVDVIIPCKGAVAWLATCLTYIAKADHAKLIRNVILVDDGSTEEELQIILGLAARLPNISVIKNEASPGFAGACNSGAAISAAEYLLFLNSDCLITPNTIPALVNACVLDKSIGLACPVSNNAANLSVPLPAGFSFLEIDEMLAKSSRNVPQETLFADVCTIVGHCLLATRNCFTVLGGFDTSWGMGYGEESDLHMRARRNGYRGVAVINTYVYHFGGGTFRYESKRAELQAENHARFISLWGEEYTSFLSSTLQSDAVKRATDFVQKNSAQLLTPDILFILPAIKHGIGGTMVVVDLCNYLITEGLNAKVLILGEASGIHEYGEALLFAPLVAKDEDTLLSMSTGLKPKIVISTLFTTALPATRFARKTGAKSLNFVQGYEFFFSNGYYYNDVRDSYRTTEVALTTSPWLAAGIKRHVSTVETYVLPLGVDQSTFFPRKDVLTPRKKLRAAVVLRPIFDKGSWVLADVIDRLASLHNEIALTLFISPELNLPLNTAWTSDSDTVCVKLPVDRYKMASYLRECDIFIDASLHEGYGLIPLEALSLGCAVVASDSGGNSAFLKDGINGILVKEVNKPDAYCAAVRALLDDRELLTRIKTEALATGKGLDQNACFKKYLGFLAAFNSSSVTAMDEFAPLKYVDEENREKSSSVSRKNSAVIGE